MRAYRMSWHEVLATDFKLFWLLNKQINRLLAEEDKRAMMVMAAAQGGELAVDVQKQLSEELGQVVVEKASLDLDAWENLKSLGAGRGR